MAGYRYQEEEHKTEKIIEEIHPDRLISLEAEEEAATAMLGSLVPSAVAFLLTCRPPSRNRKTYYKCNHIGYLIANSRHIQKAEQVVDF